MSSYLESYILNRYLYKDEKSWDDIVERVSSVHKPIKQYLQNKNFIPGGRTLATVGTNHNLIPNCVVIDIEDDLTNIFHSLNRLMELTRRGCGIGMNFGKLRPANSLAKQYEARSCGPVGFLNMYSVTLKTVQQSSRHGAFIGILQITHPDILAFINVKQDLTKITNFNLSVLIDKDFIDNLINNPDDQVKANYTIKHSDGTEEIITDINYITYNKDFVVQDVTKVNITYKELFDEVVKCMWKSGEPGILFEDNINRTNTLLNYLGKIDSCNPCVIAGTKLLTDIGQVNIEDYVGQLVNVWNGEYYTPAEVIVTGSYKDVYDIVLSDGRSLCCTEYHKFITVDTNQNNNENVTNKQTLIKKELRELDINKDVLWNPCIPGYSNNENQQPLTIKSITKRDNKADYVYCVTTLDDTHRATFNNIVTGNCGEISMYPNECCNLGSINLGSFAEELDYNPLVRHIYNSKDKNKTDNSLVEQVYNEQKPLTINELITCQEFNTEQFVKENFNIHLFKDCVKNAVIFLDKIIDLIKTDDKDIDKFVKATRRIGMGVMGLHDMLIKMKIPYDTNEARSIVHYVLSIMKEVAYKTSEQLAISNKSYGQRLIDLGYIKAININDTVPLSRANLALMTIAPNGSTSMIPNCSSGIEPYFSLGFYRMLDNATTKSELIVNKRLEEWVNKHIDNSIKEEVFKGIITKGINTIDSSIIPDYIKEVFKTAQEITPINHIYMLATCQDIVDNAISKTVNLPEDATEEDIKNCVLMSHKLKIKGMTVYRDNCRQNVIINTVSKDSCESGLCDL